MNADIQQSVTEFHYRHYLHCFDQISLINSITDKSMRECLEPDVKKYVGVIEYYDKQYPEFKTRETSKK